MFRVALLKSATSASYICTNIPQEEDETAGLDINDIDSDDLEDDEDDAFMREFRAKRLQG